MCVGGASAPSRLPYVRPLFAGSSPILVTCKWHERQINDVYEQSRQGAKELPRRLRTDISKKTDRQTDGRNRRQIDRRSVRLSAGGYQSVRWFWADLNAHSFGVM
ncbi:unnamed protein product [Onchocerca flexuosa]|uniref:Transposase n=1 Tax=Onchocerca flexuosa TaxID=387005 RepID=A0A183I216_9BILA|nr:unnamed protein product [Onchocerca flexuosa]